MYSNTWLRPAAANRFDQPITTRVQLSSGAMHTCQLVVIGICSALLGNARGQTTCPSDFSTCADGCSDSCSDTACTCEDITSRLEVSGVLGLGGATCFACRDVCPGPEGPYPGSVTISTPAAATSSIAGRGAGSCSTAASCTCETSLTTGKTLTKVTGTNTDGDECHTCEQYCPGSDAGGFCLAAGVSGCQVVGSDGTLQGSDPVQSGCTRTEPNCYCPPGLIKTMVNADGCDFCTRPQLCTDSSFGDDAGCATGADLALGGFSGGTCVGITCTQGAFELSPSIDWCKFQVHHG